MDFVSANMAKFGLLGSNNRLPPSNERKVQPFDGGFTQSSYMKLGYDGRAFNWRNGPASIFWTDYGSFTNISAGGLRKDAIEAMKEIRKKHGLFTIPNSGSRYSRFLLDVATASGLEFNTISLRIEGLPEPLEVPAHRGIDVFVRVSFREFENWIDVFSARTMNRLVKVAYVALFAELTVKPQIFDDCYVRFINQNVAFSNREKVGPSKWVLQDSEMQAALWRYLIANRKSGVPSFFRYSPKLLLSYITDPLWQDWFKENDHSRNSVPFENSFLARKTRVAYQAQASQLSGLLNWIKDKEADLARQFGGWEAEWSTPVHHFLKAANSSEGKARGFSGITEVRA